jgi:hypothetical protein
MAIRIQLRRDTAANWVSSNPVLRQGEMGIETDTLRIKLGDGTSTWTQISAYMNLVPDGSLTVGDYVLVSDIGSAEGVVGLDINKNAIITGSSIIIEGGTNNNFETTLSVTDPTADRTITFKNADGTVAFTTDIPSTTDSLTEGSTNKYFSTELAQDAIATALAAGTHTNITVTYDDTANSISLAAAPGYVDEQAVDAVAAALAAGTHTNISVGYNDAGNAISLTGAVTYTDENAQDAIGNNLGTGLSYNDTTGAISVNTATIQARVANVTDTEIGYLDGVTSAIQTQIDSKASSTSPTFTGTATLGGTGDFVINGTSNIRITPAAGSNAYIGTASADNIIATAAGLNLKAPIANPTFTGTVSGITKTMVGLGNVDNTSDANKPVSTATQTALDLKLASATAATTYAPIASPTFTGTVAAASLTLSGDLTVNGTTTTLNSTTISIDDKNIELGSVATPTDVTADGGGITLKGTTDKTFNWVDATDAWTSSEHINLATGKSLYLNGTLLKDATETLTNKTLTSPKINEDVAVTATATELNYVDGVTSAIQTQLDSKIAKTDISAKGAILVGTGSGTYAAQSVGTNGQVLTANSAQADGVEWTTISGYSAPTLGSTSIASGATVTTIAGLTLTSPTLTGTPIISGTGDFLISGDTNVRIVPAAGSNAYVGAQSATNIITTAGNTQTLTNKTLTSPVMTTPSLGAATATSINTLTVGLGGGSIVSNTATGVLALSSNTTGQYNTGFGTDAIRRNSTGVANTAFGYNTLAYTTGSYNTAVGMQVLVNNTTGASNTGVGKDVLVNNQTGSNNTAIGEATLTSTTVSNNTAVGYWALRLDTTGNSNTAVGANALTANTTAHDNTAVGHSALTTNIIGAANTAVGRNALSANTTSENTAVGKDALMSNTNGQQNASLGAYSLMNNTTGGSNTAVGYNASKWQTTGSNNTAVGNQALALNSTGSYNTAVGQLSLLNANSSNNTSIGYNALYYATGASNTALGYLAGKTGTNDLTSGSNNILIGANTAASSATVSNEITLGDANITKFRIPGLNLDTSTATNGQVLGWNGTTSKFAWTTISGYSAPTIGSTSIASGATVTSISGLVLKETSSTTISANTATTVDTNALASFTTAKYLISIKQGSKVRSSEVIVQTDGTSVDMTEFGITETGGTIAGIVVSAAVSSTNAVLQVTITDAATTNATVKINEILI